MKTSSRSIYVKIAAIALALTFGVRAYAEPPRDEIVHAYILLKHADHDYDGHREAAMKQLEGAGADLGLKLEGDDQERERQWKSDERLAEARRLVREARGKLEAHDRELAADHLGKALKELNAALKAK
jgi:hypothetical protein